MWGTYKDYKIEVFDATKKYNQKLIYISDNVLNWVKSKLFYVQNGIKRVTKSEAKERNML